MVNWPEVDQDLRDVWQAWHQMAGDRAGGMDVSGTPFTAVSEYAARYGVGDFEVFHRLILAMDRSYLDHMNTWRGSA